MRFIFFALQTIAVLSWLNYKYNVSLKDVFNNSIEISPNSQNIFSKTTLSPNATYTNYHELDIIGQQIIVLESIPVEDKLNVWLSSPLYKDMLSYFPKLERMKYFFNDRVVDDGIFKEEFLSYLDDIHMQYISGELTSIQFKNALFSPKLNK